MLEDTMGERLEEILKEIHIDNCYMMFCQITPHQIPIIENHDKKIMKKPFDPVDYLIEEFEVRDITTGTSYTIIRKPMETYTGMPF